MQKQQKIASKLSLNAKMISHMPEFGMRNEKENIKVGTNIDSDSDCNFDIFLRANFNSNSEFPNTRVFAQP